MATSPDLVTSDTLVAWAQGVAVPWISDHWLLAVTAAVVGAACLGHVLADLNRAHRASSAGAAKLREIRERAKACHRQLVELEGRAGIADVAEKIRDEPPYFLGIYDAAEPWSDKQRELETAEVTLHQQHLSRRLRDLYFSVQDAELCKELIAKARQEGDLTADYFHQERANAAARLQVARQRLDAAKWGQTQWWSWASLWGVLLIGIGSYFFGPPGALGGLLVGYFNGRRLEHGAARARESAIADADRDRDEAERGLKDAEEIWNRVRNEPQTFSRREVSTGQPDPRHSTADFPAEPGAAA